MPACSSIALCGFLARKKKKHPHDMDENAALPRGNKGPSEPSVCDGTDPTETELMAKAKPLMLEVPAVRNLVMTARMRTPRNRPRLDLHRYKYAFSRLRPATELPTPRRHHRRRRSTRRDKSRRQEEDKKEEEEEVVNEDDMLAVGSEWPNSHSGMVFPDAFDDYRRVSLIVFATGDLVLTGATSTRAGNICMCRAVLKLESMYTEEERALLT